MKTRKRAFLDIVLYLFAFLGIQIGVMAVIILITGTRNLTPSATTLSTLISSALTIVLFQWRRWTPCTGAYINTRPWFTLFWVVCLAIGLIAPVSYLTEVLGFTMSDTFTQFFKGILDNNLGFLAVGIVGPIAEEYVFRGAILRVLADTLGKRGRWAAIATSAVLFAAVHGNMAQGLGALIIGLILGWMYVRTGSIVPGVVLHWVNNSVAVFQYRLMPQSADMQFADFFGGDMKRVALAIVFSLMIVGASLFQLNMRLEKPRQ